ncbi:MULTISPECIES: thiol-disulfide oxidoreductase DCC family protein [Erwinia]|uniref:thiol-disulfide oxidoreductase DCC family protein n=1 Tax=Erwinia TaxID=551 RepID=UPI00054F7644|nr:MULTISPECIES: thiol-disulfide oxidoreductase DCC family protein [Erwinia]
MNAMTKNATGRIVLYDGVCKLCNGWVNFLLRHDKRRTVRLAAVQTDKGRALLTQAGLSPDNINTIVLLEGDRVYLRAAAIFRVLAGLPWPWRALGILRYFPEGISNRCYDLIARNRYRLFGRFDAYQKPRADYPGRFLD